MFSAVWSLFTSSAAAILFVLSAVVASIGLVMEVWCQGFRLEKYADTPLRDIERDHPHLPSLLTVIQIVLTNLQLYALSFLIAWRLSYLSAPYAWIIIGCIFVVGSIVFVLSELYWKNVAHPFFAFSTGATAVFLHVFIRHAYAVEYALIATMLTILVAINTLFLVVLYGRTRDISIPLALLGSVLFWEIFWYFNL